MFSKMDLSDEEWRHTYQCVVLDKTEKICNVAVWVCALLSRSLSHSDLSSAERVGGRKEWPWQSERTERGGWDVKIRIGEKKKDAVVFFPPPRLLISSPPPLGCHFLLVRRTHSLNLPGVQSVLELQKNCEMRKRERERENKEGNESWT